MLAGNGIGACFYFISSVLFAIFSLFITVFVRFLLVFFLPFLFFGMPMVKRHQFFKSLVVAKIIALSAVSSAILIPAMPPMQASAQDSLPADNGIS